MPEFRCECGECEGCCKNWEFGRDDDIEDILAIEREQFNFECKIYGEPERAKPWRRV
jgi:hypothetical protein